MEISAEGKSKILLIPILFFLIAIISLFHSVIFKGEVIVPGDIPYNTPVWQGESPKSTYYKANNYLLSDQINQFYIWQKFAGESIAEGKGIPLWNPYIFAGQPLVANAQSALFYPPNLFLLFFSAGTVITIKSFFNLFILGIFGFLYSREIYLSINASLFVSAVLILSGPTVVWMGHPHANVFVWFPYILFGIEKLFKRKNVLRWTSFISLGVGISLLGGHPETSFHLLLASLIYVIVRIFHLKVKVTLKKKTVLLLIFALFLGLLIGAIQTLPFSDSLLHSSTFKEGGRGAGGDLSLYSDKFIPELISGISLFYPNFFGNPVDRDYNHPYKERTNYIEQTVYFGLFPLTLFFISLFGKKTPAHIKALIFLSLFSLSLSLRFPGVELINHLPLFSLVANGRLKIFFTISAILVSGFGFDKFIRYFKNGIRNGLNRENSLLLLIPSISIVIFISVALFKSIDLVNRMGPVEGVPLKTGFSNSLFYSVFSTGNIKTMISVVVTVILFFIIIAGIRACSLRTWSVNLIVVMTIIELTIFAWNFNTTIDKSDILPKTELFKKMKNEKGPFRIIADDEIMLPNYNVPHLISLLGGYDLPVNQNYAALFYSQGGENLHNHSWRSSWPLIDLMNVRYYIKKGFARPSERKFEEFFVGGNYTVYRNRSSFPRVFIVYDYKLFSDRKKLLKEMLSGTTDLKSVALLEKRPGLSLKKTGKSDIKYISYENSFVKIEADMTESGILLFSDIYSPDWNVYIDGKKKELLRADFALRGVAVPSGKHSVTFKYQPISFTVGKYLSFLGILMAVSFLLLGKNRYSS